MQDSSEHIVYEIRASLQTPRLQHNAINYFCYAIVINKLAGPTYITDNKHAIKKYR